PLSSGGAPIKPLNDPEGGLRAAGTERRRNLPALLSHRAKRPDPSRWSDRTITLGFRYLRWRLRHLLNRCRRRRHQLSVAWANKGKRMTRNPILRKLPADEERRFTVADPTWQWAS